MIGISLLIRMSVLLQGCIVCLLPSMMQSVYIWTQCFVCTIPYPIECQVSVESAATGVEVCRNWGMLNNKGVHNEVYLLSWATGYMESFWFSLNFKVKLFRFLLNDWWFFWNLELWTSHFSNATGPSVTTLISLISLGHHLEFRITLSIHSIAALFV